MKPRSSRISRGPSRSRQGFTLLELLAVIAIITILAALLFPAITSVHVQARSSVCASRLRHIGVAFFDFASDHDGTLPGVDDAIPPYCFPPAEYWQKQFMGVEVALPGYTPTWCDPGHIGTLASYLGIAETNAATTYRCPALPARPIDSGQGSNGMFDYCMVKALAGAPISAIPHTALLFHGTENEMEVLTPLVVEEDPEFCCNNYWINTGHSNQDRLGSWHNGVGNYVTLEGSVQSIDARQLPEVPGLGHRGPAMLDWAFRLGSGVITEFCNSEINYGKWNNLDFKWCP